MAFKTGDVVQLKSGGPKMTVQRILGADKSNPYLKNIDANLKVHGVREGDVMCQWFVDTKLESAPFKQEVLKAAQ